MIAIVELFALLESSQILIICDLAHRSFAHRSLLSLPLFHRFDLNGSQGISRVFCWVLNVGFIPIYQSHRIHVYANIWGILMVTVTIYGIHGSYGNVFFPFKASRALWVKSGELAWSLFVQGPRVFVKPLMDEILVVPQECIEYKSSSSDMFTEVIQTQPFFLRSIEVVVPQLQLVK